MKKCPSRKRRYRDHEEAIAALRRIKPSSKRHRVPIRTYECFLCDGWHLTAQPERGIEPKETR